MALLKTKNWEDVENYLNSTINYLLDEDNEEKYLLDIFGGKRLIYRLEADGFYAGISWLQATNFQNFISYIIDLPERMEDGVFSPDDEDFDCYAFGYREHIDWMETTYFAFWCGFVRGCMTHWREIIQKLNIKGLL